MREVEGAVTTARKISFWSIAAVLPLIVQQHGWRALAGGVVFGLFSWFADRRYRASEQPELWMFSVTLGTQFTLAVAAAATGGPSSPALVWMVISMVSMPARYGSRGMVVGGVFSLVCLGAAVLSKGIDALVAAPDLTLATITAGIACLAYGNALRQSEGAQRQAAILDPLTGLLNRTKLEERFAEVRELAIVRHRPVAVVALDLDHFKAVNDAHGHAVGDAVLVDTAYALRGALREFELLYRVGGEEFVVFLPGVDASTAETLAERLRIAVRDARPGGLDVTVSIGVAVATGPDIQLAPQLAAADAALYAAKRGGRDRVVLTVLGQPEVRDDLLRAA